MATRKYPIGTKVIFTAKSTYDRIAIEDSGKIGTVTCSEDYTVSIFIPDSRNNIFTSGRKQPVTWTTVWEDIKLLKNQQLEFAFMNDG